MDTDETGRISTDIEYFFEFLCLFVGQGCGHQECFTEGGQYLVNPLYKSFSPKMD